MKKIKINNSLLHISLREAFLDIVPFSVIGPIGKVLVVIFGIEQDTQNIFFHSLLTISNIFLYLFPILLIISISYHLAKNYHIDRFIIISLSLLVFVSISWSIDDNFSFVYNQSLTLNSLFIPILCLYLYRFFMKLTFFQIIKKSIVSGQLRIIINSFIPLFITYLLLVNIIPYLSDLIFNYLNIWFIKEISVLSLEVKTFLHTVAIHTIWWTTGIHGTHVYSMFGDSSYMYEYIFPNITSEEFIFSFLAAGGAGATFSLVLAIIFKSKSYHVKKLGFIALPFSIFNINEILIFGLPMIMNLKFLIPFIGLPIINFFTSFLFFSYFGTPEVEYFINWATPPLVSGYLMGNGETFKFVFLQLFNITLGFFVYLPFLKAYENANSRNNELNKLKNKFDIREHINTIEETTFIKTQAEHIKSQDDVHVLVNELIKGDLLLYYQPKIDMKTNMVISYEALLRFKDKNGKIKGPYFIPQLEKAGYAAIIDIWVINKTSEDLENWKEEGFCPTVSINISPESLSDSVVVNKIINKLSDKNIAIEILERTFAKEHNEFVNNINKLRNNNFSIEIDDFGTGFSSLQYLHVLAANTIKLDRILLLNTKTKKGKILYKNIVIMCQDLGYEIVSEGVETKEEEAFLKSINVDVLQGFLYSPALPFKEIKSYEQDYNN